MRRLLLRLWSDDQGAILASEYLFVITILVIGTIVGLTSLREAINNELAEAANALLALNQSFTISGQSGSGSMTGGSEVVDTPSMVTDPTNTPAFPSLIDVIPGN